MYERVLEACECMRELRVPLPSVLDSPDVVLVHVGGVLLAQ